MTLSRCSTTSVWYGGTKKKLTSKSAAVAAPRAGQTPPTAAAATTGSRYSRAMLPTERLSRAGSSRTVVAARPPAATADPRHRRRGDRRCSMRPLYRVAGRSCRSGAAGHHDRVGQEPEQQPGHDAPGGDLLGRHPPADGEQFDDDVQDGARGQGEERDADGLVGEPLSDQGAQQRRAAADQPEQAQVPP